MLPVAPQPRPSRSRTICCSSNHLIPSASYGHRRLLSPVRQIGSTEDQPGSWMARAGATLPDFLLEASDSPLRRTVRILELSAILLPLLASPCQQFLIVAQCISRGRVGLAGAAYAPFLSTHWSLPAWMQSNHFTTLNGESGSMRECTTPVMHDTLQRVLLIL